LQPVLDMGGRPLVQPRVARRIAASLHKDLHLARAT
jgi:hypothetical protein